jgi:ornithine cyclodeaminase/alanine dehydrogenase-like protein (mu-crystallin family)
VLILGAGDVERLLDPDALIDALAAAMSDLSAGRASAPNRIAAGIPERDALLAAKPPWTPSAGALTAKLVALFPQNAGTAQPTHQALIAAFDPATGEPTALLDGTVITALRTGAGSALATRLLAREDATTLAILGTGVQARAHARMVTRVRAFTDVRVAGRDPARTQALADEIGARVAGSWEEACEGADVVCATTHADEPVVRRAWLAPGAHVTSVGYNPRGREVDAATVDDALVAVESRATALAPVPAGATELAGVDPARVVEIGELVDGRRAGRTAPDGLTLYKSVGVAVQDGAAAALVLRAALEQGAGHEIDLQDGHA